MVPKAIQFNKHEYDFFLQFYNTLQFTKNVHSLWALQHHYHCDFSLHGRGNEIQRDYMVCHFMIFQDFNLISPTSGFFPLPQMNLHCFLQCEKFFNLFIFTFNFSINVNIFDLTDSKSWKLGGYTYSKKPVKVPEPLQCLILVPHPTPLSCSRLPQRD